MGNDFRKVRDGGKLRQQGVEQRQSVLPDASIRRIYENFVEEKIDFRAQPRDGLLDRLARDAAILVVEIPFGTGFEEGFVDRSTAFEFRLFQNVANALEAGRERL